MTFTKNMQHLLTSSQIQFLILVVLAGPLLASSPDPPQRNTSFTRLPLNDVLFTEDVLMEVSARSRIECSKKCMETEGCVMCTFHSIPQGPPGHCRLHSQLKTASDDRQPTTGAKTLVRSRCNGGYLQRCDRCLKAVKKTVDYPTARDDCISMQGRLVMTKTAVEVHCVWSFMKASGIAEVWVGCNDMKKAGVYRCNDGTLLPDDSPLWDSNQPSIFSPGNQCVILKSEKSALRVGHCLRTVQFQYICQKDFL